MRSRRKRIVVSVATTSTVNITGLRMRMRGSSFLNASPIAGTRIFGSVMVVTGIRLRIWESSIELPRSIEFAGEHREMLHHGPERNRREINEAAGDGDHADE